MVKFQFVTIFQRQTRTAEVTLQPKYGYKLDEEQRGDS